jgi:phosphoglycerate dehydrogenase-like enzyme
VEEDILLSVLETDQISHVYLDVFENVPASKGAGIRSRKWKM